LQDALSLFPSLFTLSMPDGHAANRTLYSVGFQLYKLKKQELKQEEPNNVMNVILEYTIDQLLPMFLSRLVAFSIK